MSETTESCPCGNVIIRDLETVKAHWTGSICEDCESDIFAKANGVHFPTDDVIGYVAQTYALRYEELSEDTPDMSADEKHQRACIAVRHGLRQHTKTGKFVHWRDAK